MANPEHLAVLRLGAPAWNRWRNEHTATTPDLHGASLSGAKLVGMNLSGADLGTADLRSARLGQADLTSADVSRANLSGVDLREARLNQANLGLTNLSDARLIRADLGWANLNGADLRNRDFKQATFVFTICGSVDLSMAKGLDTVRHLGPSIIGVDTIYKSGGRISEPFLRGAGIPDSFITYMGSLVGKPIEFYSCFISYSTKDQEFAERLYADLQAKGVRCWFAPHHMQSGKKVHEQIDQAIRIYERLLLILSPHSMTSSWVEIEITKARRRELKEQRRVLFPVRLVDFETLRDWECFDGDTGKDSAREIREYFIPDFSQWKDHDCYQKALERLLRDLKAEEQRT